MVKGVHHVGVPSPTPSLTPTSEPQWSDLELNAVSFVILSVLASKVF